MKEVDGNLLMVPYETTEADETTRPDCTGYGSARGVQN